MNKEIGQTILVIVITGCIAPIIIFPFALLIAIFIVEITNMSDFEGASGYTAFYCFAPVITFLITPLVLIMNLKILQKRQQKNRENETSNTPPIKSDLPE